MIVGYVMNSYPMVSTTFIGREIAALEAQGLQVQRYAIRHWDGVLVDDDDHAEQAQTRYLLTGSKVTLLTAFATEIVKNPISFARAARTTISLIRNAGGGVIRHFAYLAEAVVLRRYAKADGITHLHAHFSTNSTTICMLAKTLGGPEFSMTVHGPDELFAPLQSSLGLKVDQARDVMAISYFCRSQLMLFSDQSCWPKIRIVHCGVKPSNYGRNLRTSFGKRILFVGRLDAVKGGPFLLEAFAAIKGKHTDATLTIVGDGADRTSLEQRTKSLGVAGSVTFAGYRTQADVAEMLEESDVLVLPSFAEGVPVVLMEAMASHIPVIASRVAGISELVEEGVSGFLTPPGDVATLTDRLDQLLSDPALCKRMGEAGRDKVTAEFDIDVEAAWLLKILRGEMQPGDLRP